MEFILFSTIRFTVSDPIALIEAFCFQSDFYQNYDVLENRTVEDVNRIGARIPETSLPQCKAITTSTQNLRIFKSNLDDFLKLDIKTSTEYIDDLVQKAVIPLLAVKGVGLAKVTKILHTLYPEIIPMIDSPLQEEWKGIKSIPKNKKLEKDEIKQLFIDYYQNLKLNQENLNEIYEVTKKEKLCLTKVRVFDILWWSYLKSKKHNIEWSTIN